MGEQVRIADALDRVAERIYAMRRHGLTVLALTVVLIGGSAGATEGVSPTEKVAPQPSGHIAYVRASSDAVTIWSMTASGGNQTKISSGWYDEAPAYSPNGRKIAFTTLRHAPVGWDPDNNPFYLAELYVMNADGTNPERITFNEGLAEWQPTWSPDGDKILFARGSGQIGHTDLWTINLANGKERQLTNSPDTSENYADWSPDGKRIVFEGNVLAPGGPNHPPNIDLYTIGAGGGGLRRLTTAPTWEGDPDYSPDGNRITFTIYPREGSAGSSDGGPDIYTIGVDGSGQRQLTSGQGANFTSVYSPDSRFIAFVSNRDGSPDGTPQDDIFVMRADGTQQTNLTKTEWDSEIDPDLHRR